MRVLKALRVRKRRHASQQKPFRRFVRQRRVIYILSYSSGLLPVYDPVNDTSPVHFPVAGIGDDLRPRVIYKSRDYLFDQRSRSFFYSVRSFDGFVHCEKTRERFFANVVQKLEASPTVIKI